MGNIAEISKRRGVARPQRKPGPKPGSRHSGMFTRNDPRINRGGRPKKGPEMKQLEQLCRDSAGEALDLLLDLIRDPDTPANTRLSAARELLDRGFGKPVDRTAVLNMNGPIAAGADGLSEADLIAIAAGALPEIPPGEGQVIDLEGKRPPASDLK